MKPTQIDMRYRHLNKIDQRNYVDVRVICGQDKVLFEVRFVIESGGTSIKPGGITVQEFLAIAEDLKGKLADLKGGGS